MVELTNSAALAMLDSELLKAYIDEFFGYGNLHAPVWFIGMEEGGGTSADEIARRLSAWSQRGRPTLDDLAEFHKAFGEQRFFVENSGIQRTWKELIRVALLIDGRAADTESIRAHQIAKFGRHDGTVALLELLPLPKPSTSAWPYAEWTCAEAFPELRGIRSYKKQFLKARIDSIRQLIDEHNPRAVVFYGKSYQRHWETISGGIFERGAYPMTIRRAGTTFMLLPHPAARGGSASPYYSRAGGLLHAILSQ